jgi:gliding motility-associated-like protein
MMSSRLLRIAIVLVAAFINFSAVSQNTITFNYTGEVETYVVPSCVSQLNVVIKGGQGGGSEGGAGATVSGLIDVVEGQVIEIRVGNSGGCPNGGYNGGGNGGSANILSNGGCGGGGASDIRIAPFSLADRVVVAGGGGGMGGGNTQAIGGNGACTNGGDGVSPFGFGGAGGATFAGGNGGPSWMDAGNYGGNGSLAQGGNGAIDPCYNVGPGGGGGGGNYGGGGGGSDCYAYWALGGGGGGGGSSLTPAGFTCVEGNVYSSGSITITPSGGLSMQVTPADLSYCEGDSLYLTITGADTYEWITLDGFNGSEMWLSPDTTTVYSVLGATEECSDTMDIEITVLPYPVLTLAASASTSCNDEPVTLSVTGAYQYVWSPEESLSNSTGAFTTSTPFETTTYTVTGTLDGCSSDTSITIYYQINTESNEYFCENESYIMPDGSEVNEEGIYEAQYVSIAGCDSIVELNLLEQSTYDFQTSISLCVGETFTLPDGTEVNSQGTYPVFMQTANAQCDSSITTVISILQPSTVEIAMGICEGESVTLADGSIIDEEGVYTVILASLVNGCDSTIITDVVIAPSYDLNLDLDACDDGSYLFPDGSLPSSSGTFDFLLQTGLGCDSNITVNLELHTGYNLVYPVEICDGETFSMPDGTDMGTAGEYLFLLQTNAGCDSTITVQLVVQTLPYIDMGVYDGYCLYDGNITLSPEPMGGTLSGDLLNGNVLEHEGVSPGSYEVSYIYTDGNGCTSTEVQEYVLAEPLEPSFDFYITCNELHLESIIYDPADDHVYVWALDDEIIANYADPSFYFSEMGNFDLSLTVTDIYGCTFSVNEPVELQNTLDLDGFFLPNVITPNGNNYNEKFKLPSSVAVCFEYTINIYNRWGTLIYMMTHETPAFSGRRQNGSEVPDGVYFYTLEIKNYPCMETPGLTEWCTGQLSVFRD